MSYYSDRTDGAVNLEEQLVHADIDTESGRNNSET